VTIPRGTRKLWVALIFFGGIVAPAWAQAPPLPLGSPVPVPTAPEGPRRGPITVTPTISVTGEWNDNVFQNNANKVSDFILGVTPGISVAIESPIYRLIGSYSFTSEFYADQDQLNEAFAQHNLRLDASYRVTPLLTLFLSDTFTVANNSNLVAVENVSTGRTQSTSNTLSPGLSYQLAPRDALRLRGTWTTQSYDTAGALDSDTYALEGFWDHAYTPRLTVSGGYQFAYFDVEGQPGVHTHTPRLGVSYRITPTLTGSLSGGPTFQVPETGDVEVFPAITAALQQRFAWGSATAQYDHAVGTAGGLGGTTENQSLGGTVQVDRLMRGLVLQFVPRYTHTTSTIGQNVDVDTFSITLQARYEITRWMAAIAGYTHYMQRSGGSAVTTAAGTIAANDVDQNRVFVGLQFGYPISFD